MTQLTRSGIGSQLIYRFEDQYDAWQAMHDVPATGIKAVLGQPYPG